jgi:hypothetical protein
VVIIFSLGGRNSAGGVIDTIQAGRFGDRMSVKARFFLPIQVDPKTHTVSCTVGIGVYFPGVNRLAVVLTTYGHPSILLLSSGSSWPVTGRPSPLIVSIYICNVQIPTP